MREQIMHAALAELTASNVVMSGAAAFTLEKVAARAGIEARAVRRWWPNSPALFADTMTSYAAQHLPEAPDTGTLRGDLFDYAVSYARMANTPLGRRLVDSVISRPSDWDVMGVRQAYLEARRKFAARIVQRGIERGECAPTTDPGRLIETLTLAVCLPQLVYDRSITVDDCEYAVELVLHGIAVR